jgi:hypothetical protein
MKEYIIHGTQVENLLSILQDGYIDINRREGDKIIENDIKQIFTQIIYRDLPNQESQIAHWGPCVIVLDKKILKDYAFYATRIGGFYDKFNDAFKENSNDIFVKSKGKLKKFPNLKNLKKHIDERLKNNKLDQVGFIHSHEILLNKKIYLKKYCKCIIVNHPDIIDENLILLANKLNIPIKKYQRVVFKELGLNNFINLIEE